MQRVLKLTLCSTLVAVSTFLFPHKAHGQSVAIDEPQVELESGFLHAQFAPEIAGAVLRVTGPDGYALTKQLKPGETSISADLLLEGESFRVHEDVSSVRELGTLAAGTYTFEIVTFSLNGDSSSRAGRFKVSDEGWIVRPPEKANRSDEISSSEQPGLLSRMAGAMLDFVFPSAHADTFSEVATTKGCIGPDCSEPENVETLDLWNTYAKIKRSAPSRLWFEDTSTDSPGWALLANDVSGVTHAFGIMEVLDASAADTNEGRIPFIIEEGAPEGAFRIISGGNTGINIASPQAKMHIRTSGNTFSFAPPELRLTSEFFNVISGTTTISDATLNVLGSGLWFGDDDGENIVKFNDSAGPDALVVDGNGVGIGTASPGFNFHSVVDDAGFPFGMKLENAGSGFVGFRLGTATGDIDFNNSGQDFRINIVDGDGQELNLDTNGDLTIAGTLTQGSSREIKTDIVSLSGAEILEKLSQLVIAKWSYTGTANTRHAGPMAEDFFELFALGKDEKHIAPGDMAGLSLAAIKELSKRNDELRAQNASLKDRLQRLEAVVFKEL